jgi:hypothetical protein
MKNKGLLKWLMAVGFCICAVALLMLGSLWHLYDETTNNTVENFLSGKTDRLGGWDTAEHGS